MSVKCLLVPLVAAWGFSTAPGVKAEDGAEASLGLLPTGTGKIPGNRAHQSLSTRSLSSHQGANHRLSIQDLYAGSRWRPGFECMTNPVETLWAAPWEKEWSVSGNEVFKPRAGQ